MLLEKGWMGELAFVATQSDIFNRSELIENLHLSEEATVLECALARNAFTKKEVCPPSRLLAAITFFPLPWSRVTRAYGSRAYVRVTPVRVTPVRVTVTQPLLLYRVGIPIYTVKYNSAARGRARAGARRVARAVV